jgi:hypothetical protein
MIFKGAINGYLCAAFLIPIRFFAKFRLSVSFACPLATLLPGHDIRSKVANACCLWEGGIRAWGAQVLKKRPGPGISLPVVGTAHVIDGHGSSSARGMNELMAACINAHVKIVFFAGYGEKHQISGQQLVPVDPPALPELLPCGSGHRDARSLICKQYQTAAVKPLDRGVSAPSIGRPQAFNGCLDDDSAGGCQNG